MPDYKLNTGVRSGGSEHISNERPQEFSLSWVIMEKLVLRWKVSFSLRLALPRASFPGWKQRELSQFPPHTGLCSPHTLRSPPGQAKEMGETDGAL